MPGPFIRPFLHLLGGCLVKEINDSINFKKFNEAEEFMEAPFYT